MTMLLEGRDLRKSFGTTTALAGANVRLEAGEVVALMGASGSGKSTLLHCLAGILRPNTGSVVFDGVDVGSLPEKRRSDLRLRRFGFVFQFGDLVPELTLRENVALPLQLGGVKHRAALERADALLEELAIADVADHRAGAASGGQAQRAAVARALVHEPSVLFADEPTGSLDTVTGEAVLDALVSLARRRQSSVLLVTHDHRVAAHADREVVLRDGRMAAGVNA